MEENKKKGMKKGTIFIVISIILVIIMAVSTAVALYFRQKALEEEMYQIAVATVDEINEENLTFEYNKEYTKEDIKVQLSTTSKYTLAYRVEALSQNTENEDYQKEYINYEAPIIIAENSNIFLKYINDYGTYSKEEYMIKIDNIDKEIPTITKKETSVTTNTIKINVEAKDNVKVDKIEVSIDNKNYKEVTKNNYTFDKLKEGTEYTINIQVKDTAGNVKTEKVKAKTKVTPQQATTNVASSSSQTKPTSSSSSSTTSQSKPTTSNNSSSSQTSSSGLTTKQKEAAARKVAKQIASSITGSTDLEKVTKASQAVYGYYARGVHKETGNDFYTAYGVFILGESSCAGCCRALGMVLSEMGYSYKHVNENLWKHQWLTLKMDGQQGWADANVGMAGYGTWRYLVRLELFYVWNIRYYF